MSHERVPTAAVDPPAAITAEVSRFAEVLRAFSGELRVEDRSPVELNQLATRLDRLGRRLHGLGCAREHEIGRCLTAAVGELSRARGLPDTDRASSVRQAIRQLESALAYIDEGLRPQQAAGVTELAPRGIGDQRS